MTALSFGVCLETTAYLPFMHLPLPAMDACTIAMHCNGSCWLKMC